MSFHWLVGDIIKEDAALATVPSRDRARTTIRDDELDELLELHQEWVESKGASGSRLELTRADFEAADLTGVNLQGAILNGANFHGAELLLADLRGASLVQANLQETNLLGADLRGANLEGASLAGAAGLHTNQLAGAGLLWTILPAAISEFEGQQVAQVRSRQCFRLLIATIAACVLSWLRILTTRDVQFLNDAPLLRILPSSGILPVSSFYVLMPIALFGLFVYLQIALQRLWERLGELPAVFPDGRALDRTGPWLLMTLFHSRFRDWRANWIAPSTLQTIVPSALAYWAVPATLLLFWVRYLVMQDVRGSMLQILLLLLSVGIAMQLPRVRNGEVHAAVTVRAPEIVVDEASETPSSIEGAADSKLDSESDSIPDSESISESVSSADAEEVSSMEIVPAAAPSPAKSFRSHPAIRRSGFAFVVGASLLILTLGVVYGVPHDTSVMPDFGQFSIKRWAADAFWTLGYRPYADLTETSVSQAPKNWSWRDDDLSSVKGAQLNNLKLRYAQAYRTFWANAHLWKADLQGAYFSESDFRGANLREANLRSAIFDRVQFYRANLQGSDLERANLTRADLRETDLSYARMVNAILVDSRLGGANLFGADLRSAQLAHANIEKADLRDANLANANLKLADLQEAYLWSAQLPGAELQDADLSHAILIEANLQNVDLRGADLRGAVVRGTDFSGADIAGTDFRGASGLTAPQVCSAKEHESALLDDALTPLVEAQCRPQQLQPQPQAQPQAQPQPKTQPAS